MLAYVFRGQHKESDSPTSIVNKDDTASMTTGTMYIQSIAFLILTTTFSACSTTQLSSQELSDLQIGKKSLLRTYNQPLPTTFMFDSQPVMQIISVDSKRVDSQIFRTDDQIVLGPGVHQIELNCVSRDGYHEKDYSEIIELEVKPRMEYHFRCSFDSRFGDSATYDGTFSIKEYPSTK